MITDLQHLFTNFILSKLLNFSLNILHLIPALLLIMLMLRGIVYNSSTKGKCADTKDSEITESTENCGSEKKNTEVENDKKVSFISFDNVTNVG